MGIRTFDRSTPNMVRGGNRKSQVPVHVPMQVPELGRGTCKKHLREHCCGQRTIRGSIDSDYLNLHNVTGRRNSSP